MFKTIKAKWNNLPSGVKTGIKVVAGIGVVGAVAVVGKYVYGKYSEPKAEEIALDYQKSQEDIETEIVSIETEDEPTVVIMNE